jgi:hypothetical protein
LRPRPGTGARFALQSGFLSQSAHPLALPEFSSPSQAILRGATEPAFSVRTWLTSAAFAASAAGGAAVGGDTCVAAGAVATATHGIAATGALGRAAGAAGVVAQVQGALMQPIKSTDNEHQPVKNVL